MRESEVETPALILDLDAFEFNLDTMARMVAGVSARLRPHAKTHKSPVVANLQMRRGAIGQCVQKVAEAEVMAWGGVEDILVTNQIVDPRKLARLAALSRIAQVALCVDSPEHVSLLEAAARTAGVRMSVLVEIDVGSRRCGVPAGEEAVGLARLIAGSRHLAFAGLQAYHGAAQHLRSAVERREAIGKAIAACERTVEGLSRARIPCGIVSGAPEFDTNCRKCLICIDQAFKLALQQGDLVIEGGFIDVECGQRLRLAGLNCGYTGDRCAVIDTHGVPLDAAQLCQGSLGREFAAGEFEALAHDPVQDQRHEADAGVGLDALGQAVEDGGDLDIGLEHPEAAFDIGQ